MSTWQVAFTPQINAFDQKTARLDEKEDKNRAKERTAREARKQTELKDAEQEAQRPASTLTCRRKS
jgi:hypothetical protein